MSTIRVLAYIAAAILIIFGFLFIYATFSPTGSIFWLLIGVLSVAGGFGLIWFAGKQAKKDKMEIIQKIDFSGDVNLEKLTCQSCGGTLSSKNVTMLAGAPVVSCPYCNASYQLTEEPKW